jgi:PDZ domain
MKTLARNTVLALLASLTLISISTSPAVAAGPKALLLNPGPYNGLPKFGFQSFNIQGYGERVTYVQWGGRAAQLGLEPGDVILSLNGFPLTYHGSWNDALYQTASNSGLVRLKIRNVRNGQIAFRQIYTGGIVGPITVYNTGYGSSYDDYCEVPPCDDYSYGPYGPITSKSHKYPQGNDHFHGNNNVSVKDLVKMFDKSKKQ